MTRMSKDGVVAMKTNFRDVGSYSLIHSKNIP